MTGKKNESIPWLEPVQVVPGFEEHHSAEGPVTVHTPTGGAIRLNDPAYLIWRLCREGSTPAEIAARIQHIAAADEPEVADDVADVLETLLGMGLLEAPRWPALSCANEALPVEIITLGRDADRRRHVATRLLPVLHDTVGYSLSPRIFDAVDGEDRTAVERTLDRLEVKVSPQFERDGTPGQVGCYLSHLSVMRRMIDEGIPASVIMEDDVALRDNNFGLGLRRIANELSDMDWDIVYLYIFDHHFDEQADNEAIRIPGKEYVVRPYFCWCTLAYLVNLSGARKILAGSRTLTKEIDLRLQEMIESGELNALYTNRQLVVNLGQKTRDIPPAKDEFVSNVLSEPGTG